MSFLGLTRFEGVVTIAVDQDLLTKAFATHWLEEGCR